MDGEKYEAIYCDVDGEYSVYCNVCDKHFFERFKKNHLKSITHNNIIRKKVLYN